MKPILYLAALLALSAGIPSCKHKKINMVGGTDSGKIAIHNNGLNIAYTDTSNVSDTTLLFVHGWGINRSYWSAQQLYFAKRYRVVTMDLPGFGQSGKNRKDWSTKAFASDVDSVIAALKLKKVILIGHSMSGDVVLQAAVDNPNKVIGLVGVDNFKGAGVPGTEQGKKEFTDAMVQMKLHFKQISTSYFNQALFSKTTQPEIRKRILNDVANADSVVAIAAMEQTEGYDEIASLKQAKKKLYLISSDVTPTDTTYLVKNKIPFKIYYVPGSGHYPMNEHPETFNMLLGNVIGDLSRPLTP
jgi:pimeloyl-ACP methyl ester carboxylesterase